MSTNIGIDLNIRETSPQCDFNGKIEGLDHAGEHTRRRPRTETPGLSKENPYISNSPVAIDIPYTGGTEAATVPHAPPKRVAVETPAVFAVAGNSAVLATPTSATSPFQRGSAISNEEKAQRELQEQSREPENGRHSEKVPKEAVGTSGGARGDDLWKDAPQRRGCPAADLEGDLAANAREDSGAVDNDRNNLQMGRAENLDIVPPRSSTNLALSCAFCAKPCGMSDGIGLGPLFGPFSVNRTSTGSSTRVVSVFAHAICLCYAENVLVESPTLWPRGLSRFATSVLQGNPNPGLVAENMRGTVPRIFLHVGEVIQRCGQLLCEKCNQPGATVSCAAMGCSKRFHLPCAAGRARFYHAEGCKHSGRVDEDGNQREDFRPSRFVLCQDHWSALGETSPSPVGRTYGVESRNVLDVEEAARPTFYDLTGKELIVGVEAVGRADPSSVGVQHEVLLNSQRTQLCSLRQLAWTLIPMAVLQRNIRPAARELIPIGVLDTREAPRDPAIQGSSFASTAGINVQLEPPSPVSETEAQNEPLNGSEQNADAGATVHMKQVLEQSTGSNRAKKVPTNRSESSAPNVGDATPGSGTKGAEMFMHNAVPDHPQRTMDEPSGMRKTENDIVTDVRPGGQAIPDVVRSVGRQQSTPLNGSSSTSVAAVGKSSEGCAGKEQKQQLNDGDGGDSDPESVGSLLYSDEDSEEMVSDPTCDSAFDHDDKEDASVALSNPDANDHAVTSAPSDSGRVENVMQYGFSKDIAENALRITNGDVSAALLYLLGSRSASESISADSLYPADPRDVDVRSTQAHGASALKKEDAQKGGTSWVHNVPKEESPSGTASFDGRPKEGTRSGSPARGGPVPVANCVKPSLAPLLGDSNSAAPESLDSVSTRPLLKRKRREKIISLDSPAPQPSKPNDDPKLNDEAKDTVSLSSKKKWKKAPGKRPLSRKRAILDDEAYEDNDDDVDDDDKDLRIPNCKEETNDLAAKDHAQITQTRASTASTGKASLSSRKKMKKATGKRPLARKRAILDDEAYEDNDDDVDDDDKDLPISNCKEETNDLAAKDHAQVAQTRASTASTGKARKSLGRLSFSSPASPSLGRSESDEGVSSSLSDGIPRRNRNDGNNSSPLDTAHSVSARSKGAASSAKPRSLSASLKDGRVKNGKQKEGRNKLLRPNSNEAERKESLKIPGWHLFRKDKDLHSVGIPRLYRRQGAGPDGRLRNLFYYQQKGKKGKVTKFYCHGPYGTKEAADAALQQAKELEKEGDMDNVLVTPPTNSPSVPSKGPHNRRVLLRALCRGPQDGIDSMNACLFDGECEILRCCPSDEGFTTFEVKLGGDTKWAYAQPWEGSTVNFLDALLAQAASGDNLTVLGIPRSIAQEDWGRVAEQLPSGQVLCADLFHGLLGATAILRPVRGFDGESRLQECLLDSDASLVAYLFISWS